MRSLLAPWLMASAIWEINLDQLAAEGIRGLILDLDNTLVEWNATGVSPRVRRWLEEAHRRRMRGCLVSNASRGTRVRKIAAELGLLVVTWACKPLPIAFRRAMAQLETDPAATCAIGDQVFTDMLGANWLGIRTVLLNPLAPRESPHTRAIRLIERPLRMRWARIQGAANRGRGDGAEGSG